MKAFRFSRCVCLVAIFLICAPVFAIRYIDVSSVTNVPLINIKTIEDFEEIIGTYQIPFIYRVSIKDEAKRSSSYDNERKADTIKTTLFVMANGTYFSFFVNEYTTIADYKTGTSAQYKNGRDFYTAKKLGIESSDFYYWYSDNHFRSVEDALDAYKKGFFSVKSEDYYKAKELNYSSYTDYTVYCKYTQAGFKTKNEWETAQKAGFANAEIFHRATEAGFTTNSEYKDAQKVGLQDDKTSYDFYVGLTNSINKIVEKDKLSKKEAFVLTLLQSFPKGEMSISVLTGRLQDMINQKKDVKRPLNQFIFDDPQGKSYYSDINQLITTSELKLFFSTVDISKIGSYDNKT
ncbi:MAG: hypothetical protein J5597_05990, partial [Spirochaetaceae bacterium]|nr:hypothetical protein [Spirochaetaceae bacterium]